MSAWKTGSLTSLVATATYVLQPAALVITPTAGVYTESQSVTITTSSPGVSIRYTTDGSDPTETSPLYTVPLTVNTQTTVKARGFRPNWQASAIAASTFTFNYGTVATPSITPLSSTYLSSVTVTIEAEPGATIRYTLDGTAPTEASLLYSAPFSTSAATVVNAKAFRVDYTPSATRTVPYWVKVGVPAVTPAAGEWPADTLITATAPTVGARVHYTIDGREPTTSDPAFDASAPLYVGNFTLKARGFLAGDDPSDIVERAYTLSSTLSIGAVAAGSTHSIALRPDGTVAAWGDNGVYRKLGVVYCSAQGVASSNRPIMSEATAIKAIGVTSTATAAVRVDGHVVTWGQDDYEQLGHELPSTTCTSLETADRPTPREVSGLTDVVSVDGGLFHFLALKADQTVWGWGQNTDGQLGNDATQDTGTPVQASGLTGVTMISAGQNHSLAVKSDGSLWSWGSNNWSQLGVACCGNRLTPEQVTGVSAPIAIAAGWNTSYAVLADGSVVVWGAIPSGLVPGAGMVSSTPLNVPGLSAIKSIIAGATATYALGEDGRLWSWGQNQFGQLGDGSTTTRNTPGLVPNLPAIRSASASHYHVLAVADDGSVWSWGRNESGEVGDLTTGDDRLTPMVVMHDGALDPVTIETPGTLDPGLDRVSYYHTDAIGSVRVITNASGQTLQSYDYKAFGEESVVSGTESNNRRFTAQERDLETELDYFGARYYESPGGRFRSVDPLMDVEAALTDPQQWNRYAYVRNNPLNFVDPSGASIELIGSSADRDEAMKLLRKGVGGGRAGDMLFINDVVIDGTVRYFVGIQGDVGQFMQLGESAHTLANLVLHEGIVEFRLTKDDLSFHGGSRTIEPGKVGNSNIRVLVNPFQAPGALQNTYGLTRFEPGGKMRAVTPSIAAWHEFGHAWGLLHGRQMVDTAKESVDWENIMREVVYGPFGSNNARRRRH